MGDGLGGGGGGTSSHFNIRRGHIDESVHDEWAARLCTRSSGTK